MDEEEIYQLFMEEIKKYPVLSKKETNKLLYEYQVEHNQESYEKLLLHNLGLVVIMARKYVGKSKTMGLLDFIQENYLIMRKAIASFDVNKGYQLSTYICDSMGYSLQLKIDQKDATIKLPVKLKQGERKYVKYIYDYYKETGKRPDKKQIEHFAKIDLKQQKKIENIQLYNTISLNIEEQMKNTSAFMNRFLIPENIDQIYRMVRNTLPVREILELDIKPENAFLRDFFTLCPEHNAHLENAFKSAWKEESSKTPYIKKIPSVNKEG